MSHEREIKIPSTKWFLFVMKKILILFENKSNWAFIYSPFFCSQTGHIRTSGGSFFIEPSPLTDGNRVDDSQTTGAVRHVIYRVRHPFRFEQPLPSSSTSRPVRAQRDDSHHHLPSDGAPPGKVARKFRLVLFVLVIPREKQQKRKKKKGLHHRC